MEADVQNKYTFNAEVGKVLKLMIHSLYTNKDIFLRELISNASDAIDKIRYLSVTNPDLSKDDHDYKIVIKFDSDKKIMVITDNGIGMSRDDLFNNLGTIAKSGTQGFLEQLSGDAKKDTNLIGQFGVGFYSAFMVAHKVSVKSRKAGESEAWQWESDGEGEFSIEPCEYSSRGTEITLHFRDEEAVYLDKHKISHIVKAYSDHIAFPIVLHDTEGKHEVLNSSSALWTRNKSDITEEDYKNFYKTVSHSFDNPWMTIHNRNEGMVSYVNLLFVPENKPFDLFHPDRMARVKLYIKKVFISESVDLIPSWLRFVRGVIDSEDLPLNISRETLQHNAILDKIKKGVVKRVLSELKKKLESDREGYLKFWDNFGAVVKEGLCEGGEFRDEIMDICLFNTTYSDELVTFKEYISRMKEDQKTIYYLTGTDIESTRKSPQLEGFTSKGYEVLLFSDHVDEFWVNVFHEYQEKEIKSITRAEIDLGKDETNESKEENKIDENKLEALKGKIKEVIGDRIKEVKESKKLTNSPVCISVAEGAMDIRMERFLIEQKQLKFASPKILEINTNHPLISYLASVDEFSDADKALVKTLYNQACIVEGEPVLEVNDFASTIVELLSKVYK
ncbi:MAG: molecular chaperone HtpG [Alphaproteobacteria bacterium]|mgnify:CR=1 FL=1|nr:molecular chaperone HtpG [Alphaproteobacteria bacterium]OJV12258.1 MAG: molecular chaperone HtpG [Alphaproteobacteria bacterium 33-17]